ncbi:tetratricopeptide repeat protein [bacterium]|nr:tetratricopeptide repeat protein [bacterium]
MIKSVKQNEDSVSLNRLQLEFSKIEVNTNLVTKINPSDIPLNLEYSEIQLDILNQFFPQNLSTFPLKWTMETNIKENTYSLFLSSQIVDKRIAVIDFPLTEYEKALNPSVTTEHFSSYLFQPHNFVMLSLIKVLNAPDFAEKTPVVQSYSWDTFYNTILLKICRLLNSVGMSLYRKGDNQKAYDYFFSAQHEKLPITYYNTACMSSLLGDISGAIENLKNYIPTAPDEWKDKIKKDKDFDGIRKTLEFQEFLEIHENLSSF